MILALPVLILNSRGVVFIHLHRCGGSTVEASMAALLRWNDILLGSTEAGEALQPIYHRLFGLHKHSSAAEVKAVIGDATWSKAFTFSTVRCPYERTASLFNFAAAAVEERLTAVGFPLAADWREQRQWVERWTTPPAHFWHWPVIRAYLFSRGAPQPFSAFLRERALVELEVAHQPQSSRLFDQNGRRLVAEIVKLEELDSHWARLCNLIDAHQLPLVKANETPAAYRRSFAALTRDPDDLHLVRQRFAADFEAFGYPSRPS